MDFLETDKEGTNMLHLRPYLPGSNADVASSSSNIAGARTNALESLVGLNLSVSMIMQMRAY